MKKARPLTIRKSRLGLVTILMLVGLMALICRLFYLQIIDGDRLKAEAEQQMIGEITIRSPRGTIIDINGDVLAVSIMTKSLYVDHNFLVEEALKREKPLDEKEIIALSCRLLGPALNMDEATLGRLAAIKGGHTWIKRNLDNATYLKVREIITKNDLKGFAFTSESQRVYPKKRAAAQVIGFVGTDDKGLEGLEYTFNKVLQSSVDKYFFMEDSRGRRLWGGDRENQEGEKLGQIQLTLDGKIQYVLEEAMDAAIAKTKAAGAAAIIMDPYTGAILGMANRPTFDPNYFYRYSSDAYKNRAIGMIYEPGSVFKPIVGCMGLTEGLIKPETLFNDKGHVVVADRTIYNWDKEGRGLVPFSEIIKHSINTGMVELGLELGARRMIDYAKRFGFGKATNIEIAGEEAGLLYRAEDMYKPDIATMAIGQGIAVTPLQVLRAICAIANGGELLQPYIIHKVTDRNGQVIKEGKKQVVDHVISPQVAQEMRAMMEQVVAGGGGKTAAIKGYRIAGKTGTAEKIKAEGGYDSGKYIASFVGFVPTDKPKYAMLVMLDTPQGAFYGSQVAAPIFQDTLQRVLAAKGIQPVNKEGLPSFEELHAKYQPKEKAAGPKALPVMEPLATGKIKLADFKGLEMRQVAELLHSVGLRLKPYGTGKVVRQEPAAGTEVLQGSTIKVYLE